MQHFYDGQVRRYITQIVRLLSNFSYKDGKGNLKTIPVTYGDLTRQVGAIIRDNSENKIPSAPRMAVYITGLEMDRDRTSDSSYVNKVNIRELAYDTAGAEYLKTEGKNYTVERLMPSPYTLRVNVDIWSTNTDQKLQIMEQILMLFNPSLEIQTTDNYVDWTSLSVVNLDNIQFSNRSIPVGVESEIDIGTLTFSTPIYITPPAKVKKLGVITNIITAVFADNGLEINLDDTAYAESLMREAVEIDEDNNLDTVKRNGTREGMTFETGIVATSHGNYDLLFLNGRAKLLGRGVVGAETWTGYLKSIPEVFQSGITELRLQRRDGYGDIVGTVAINSADETELVVNLDPDTLPSDTTIAGRSGIDYIIDPTQFDPRTLALSSSPRILLLGNIGNTIKKTLITTSAIQVIDTEVPYNEVTGVRVLVNSTEVSATHETWGDSSDVSTTYKIKFPEILNIGDTVTYELFLDEDGPDAWKNADGSDFAAFANDIVEYDNGRWNIVFNAATVSDTTYATNLNTGIQYKWSNGEWVLSFEGEYPDGTWRLNY